MLYAVTRQIGYAKQLVGYARQLGHASIGYGKLLYSNGAALEVQE
jgi:hypothetical protein